MKLINTLEYQEMSKVAVDILIETVTKNPKANICLASGGSPDLAYKLFVEKVQKDNIDISGVVFTKLDEWCGFDQNHESTCEVYLQEAVIRPLGIKEENYISFNSDADDFQSEAQRIQHELEMRPIDLCVLGLGRNGHLGLNEPSDKLQAGTHIIELDEATKKHPLLKQNHVTHGMTIGMEDIFNSNQILFLVSGEGKKEVYCEFMKREITTKVPASFLWLHNNVTTVVSEDYFK